LAIEVFWQKFLKSADLDDATKPVDVFHFDLTKEAANNQTTC